MVEQGRGPLPFLLLRGEALVAYAGHAVGAAGLVPVDVGTPWSDLQDAEAPVVLHDPACPLTPAEFLADCATRSLTEDAVVVGVRPVTDTVKEVADGVLGGTVDRESLQVVCSPLVLPARLVAALADLPGGPDHDFAAIAAALVEAGERVLWQDAPPEARRVTSEDDVRVLQAITAEDVPGESAAVLA